MEHSYDKWFCGLWIVVNSAWESFCSGPCDNWATKPQNTNNFFVCVLRIFRTTTTPTMTKKNNNRDCYFGRCVFCHLLQYSSHWLSVVRVCVSYSLRFNRPTNALFQDWHLFFYHIVLLLLIPSSSLASDGQWYNQGRFYRPNGHSAQETNYVKQIMSQIITPNAHIVRMKFSKAQTNLISIW